MNLTLDNPPTNSTCPPPESAKAWSRSSSLQSAELSVSPSQEESCFFCLGDSPFLALRHSVDSCPNKKLGAFCLRSPSIKSSPRLLFLGLVFNMLFSLRRRVLDGLNRRYIYGCVVCDFSLFWSSPVCPSGLPIAVAVYSVEAA